VDFNAGIPIHTKFKDGVEILVPVNPYAHALAVAGGAYILGGITADTASMTGNVTVTGTLTSGPTFPSSLLVSGATTLQGNASIRNSLNVGTRNTYANVGWDGWITAEGANAGILVSDIGGTGWGAYWRVSGTNLFLYRHDGYQLGQWDLVNLRFGINCTPVQGLGVNQHISMQGSSNNLILFGTNGVAPPGANSLGEKISLYGPQTSVNASDYSLGVESNALWINSGGGEIRQYFAATLANRFLNGGYAIFDASSQRGAGAITLMLGGSTAIGIGSNNVSGGANNDANQLGMDFYTANTIRQRILQNGSSRFGGTSAATNVAGYNNALVGAHIPNPGAGAGAEGYVYAASSVNANWSNLTLSWFTQTGGGAWNNFGWLIGQNIDGGIRNGGPYLYLNNTGLGINQTTVSYLLHVQGTAGFAGAITKSGGGFLIDHPLDPDNKDLYHGFVEGPRQDLIYRGKKQLVNGKCIVNIDTDCVREGAQPMTPGTFAALTRDAQLLSLFNTTNRDPLWASEISEGAFSVECENDRSADIISWAVIAERNDPFQIDHEHTDENGNMILERVKEEPPPGIVESLDTPLITENEADEDEPDREQDEDAGLRGFRGYPRHPEAIGRTMAKRKRIIRTVKRAAP